MFLKYIIYICFVVCVVDVEGDCKNFFECLSEFIKNYVDTNDTYSSNEIENYVVSFVPKLYLDDKDIKKSLQEIESDLLSMLEDDTEFKLKESIVNQTKIYNNTKVFVKIQALGKNGVKHLIRTKTTRNYDLENENATEISSIPQSVTKSEDENEITETDLIQTTESPRKSIKENVIESDIDTIDYYSDTENDTDYPIIDYAEYYKDTTNEVIDITTELSTSTDTGNDIQTEINVKENYIDNSNIKFFKLTEISSHETPETLKQLLQREIEEALSKLLQGDQQECGQKTKSMSKAVFPWVTTIFVKNETNSTQFDYYCDGTLLTNQTILTSARCVSGANGTLPESNLVLVFGKRSLHTSGPEELILGVKSIKLHENFTNENGFWRHDLALLYIEGAVEYSEGIQPACWRQQGSKVEFAATTGWSISGEITSINFGEEKSKTCLEKEEMENLFCATYGEDITVCPSYGGLHVGRTKENQWYLQGVLSGDPRERVCINKTVKYTDVTKYGDWIENNIKENFVNH